MRTRAPVMCKRPDLLEAAAEARAQNSITGQLKAIEIMSVWRTQYGVGKEGAGATGYKLKPARRLARLLAEQASKYKTRGRSA